MSILFSSNCLKQKTIWAACNSSRYLIYYTIRVQAFWVANCVHSRILQHFLHIGGHFFRTSLNIPYYGAIKSSRFLFNIKFQSWIDFFPISTKRKTFWKTFPNRMFYMYVRNLEVLFYVGVNAVCILQCVINIMDSWAHIRVLRRRKRHKYVWEKRQFFLLLISLGIL